MKNLVKSIFISSLPVYGLVTGIYAITYINVLNLPWLGVAVGALTIGLFFMWLLIFRPVARTKGTLPEFTWLIIGATLFTLVTSFINSASVSIPAVSLALISSISWFIYIFWYSKFANRSNNEFLQVGQQLPDFELENEQGEKVQSTHYLGNSTLWMFYRGNWCPLCVAQIREIAAQYQELSQRGVKVALISPQPHKHTRQLAQKMEVPFDFLVDVKNKVAQQLHINSEHGIPKGMEVLGYDSETVMPTVVMTNASGKIIFADLTDNYRVRPEPATFLKVLDEQAVKV